jgi:hypothetical protein
LAGQTLREAESAVTALYNADYLVPVVRAEATPIAPVRRALEILDNFGVTPEGIVFNSYLEKRRLMGKNYTYGYGKYGTCGTYGSVYGDEEE